MLVVKVEVWPGGEEDRGHEIARIGVSNRTGDKRLADYEVIALLARDLEEQVISTEIHDHDRTTGWVPLVRRVLTNLILRDSVCDTAPYDDPTAEHLRRGEHVGQPGHGWRGLSH